MSELKLPNRRPDLPLLLITIGLIVIGIIMIISTSSVVGYTGYNDSYYFIKKHCLYLLMGIGLFTLGLKTPHERYSKWGAWGLAISCILVALTMVPGIGVMAFGARRWINLGFISFQPVELLKFFVIVFTAFVLTNKKDKIRSFKKGLVPLFAVVLIPILLTAKQPDLGNTMLMGVVIFALLFVGRARLFHLFGMVGLGLGGMVGSILIHPYQMQRIRTFLDPFADPLGKSYHIVQSFIAIGSGGIWGVGIGQSRLKYSYLPLQYSDFIFSIICEEGGFLLAMTVILLLVFFFQRGMKIAMQSHSLFSYYLALGLTLQIVLQSLINIAVVIGVFPTKGIPLAFISFGGTSLIMSMFVVGVLLNISMSSPPKGSATNAHR
jgi:cell division protein FtsW